MLAMQRFVQFFLSWKFCCAAAKQVDCELVRLGVWGGGGGVGRWGQEGRREGKNLVFPFPPPYPPG